MTFSNMFIALRQYLIFDQILRYLLLAPSFSYGIVKFTKKKSVYDHQVEGQYTEADQLILMWHK